MLRIVRRAWLLLGLLASLACTQGCLTLSFYHQTVGQIGRSAPDGSVEVKSLAAVGGGAPDAVTLFVRGCLGDGTDWDWVVDGDDVVVRSCEAAGVESRTAWREVYLVEGTGGTGDRIGSGAWARAIAPGRRERGSLDPAKAARAVLVVPHDGPETLVLDVHVPPPGGREVERAEGGEELVVLEPPARTLVLPKPRRPGARARGSLADVGRTVGFVMGAPLLVALDAVTLPVQVVGLIVLSVNGH